MTETTRRSALAAGVSMFATGLICPRLAAQDAPATRSVRNKPDKGPQIDPALIKQFVGAGHGDLDAVRQMLAERPSLVNGVWDWGGGDFETALGGAAHMGRADIAAYLVEHGARLDLFAAAVLGKIEIIRTAAAAFPGIHRTPGPHGIPLIAHAKKAGQDEIVRLIESLDSVGG